MKPLKCMIYGHDYGPYERSNVVFHDDGNLYRLVEHKCRRCGYTQQQWRTSQPEFEGDVEIQWKPFCLKTNQ